MPVPKPIPIATAERICKAHEADQVIIFARTVGEGCGEHVTTYGKDKLHCAAAARIGDAIGRQVIKPLEELVARAEKAEQELSAHKAVHNIGLPQEGYRELVWREAHEFYEGGGFDIVAHLERQRAFSLKTFGPGPRTKGVIDHIRKELVEIEADPTDLKEWVDLILLAFDGAWRAGFEPRQIVEGIEAKQTKNEGRNWPDWRTADPDKAIEHVRSVETSADPIRQAALRLIEAMDDAQSFEVEAGCSGEGPLVDLVNALGIKTPQNLQAWLDDSDDANEPCDRCGEHHPAGAMEDGLCPACADDAEDERG